jgi:hypothetical protein
VVLQCCYTIITVPPKDRHSDKHSSAATKRHCAVPVCVCVCVCVSVCICVCVCVYACACVSMHVHV